jgi:hypothetical protein
MKAFQLPQLNEKQQEYAFLVLLLIFSGLLLFLNLDNRYMWQDEAQTVLIARTVVDRGLPYGTDGRNFFSQYAGREYGENHLWKWHPWLQFYAPAPFLKVFGFSNFIARLPFALFALAAVALAYFFVKELFNSRRKAMLAASILALYVPFLILGRMARYYSPEMFFCLLSLFAYTGFLNGKKYSRLLYVVSLTLLFHTLYVYFFALIAACLAHVCLFRRDKAGSALLLSAAAMALNVPFLFTIYKLDALAVQPNLLNPMHFLDAMRMHAAYIVTELPAWWLLALVPAYFAAKKFFKFQLGTEGIEYLPGLMLLLFFIASAMIFMSIFAVIPFYRDLAGAVPVFAIICALLIAPAFHIRFSAGLALVLIFASLGQLPSYIYEITHDYRGPVKGMAGYLNKKGSPDDTVLITYGDMPLKLYTKMRVLGGLTGEPVEPAKDAKWVIIRKHVMEETDQKTADYIRANLDRKNYMLTAINYPDDYDENTERPTRHKFRTDSQADMLEDRVLIYERVK